MRRFTARALVVALVSVSATAEAQSWNMLFGGVEPGGLFQGELGFSSVPRLSYHYGMSDSLSIGGLFAFDIAGYTPSAAPTANIQLAAPIRVSLIDDLDLSVGLRTEPGFAFIFAGQFGFGILLPIALNVGIPVGEKFIVGGGVEIPFTIIAVPYVGVSVPILFGPSAEIHVKPNFALTFDAKLGPTIWSSGSSYGYSSGGVLFGLKLHVGAAYKF